MKKYYGGWETDKIIETYFTDKKPEDGVAIEVGMGEGIVISNTYYFELLGWNVLCIEPNPIYFQSCKRSRKNVLPFACGKENRDNATFKIFDMGSGHNDSYGSCSALETEIENRTFNAHKHLIRRQFEAKVSVRTLDFILENNFKVDLIDFISIDTEGNEIDVLKGFDINRWKPKLFIKIQN